jgi:hypothetical protein
LLVFSGAYIRVADHSDPAPEYQLSKFLAQVLLPIFGNRGMPVTIKRNCSVAGLDPLHGR